MISRLEEYYSRDEIEGMGFASLGENVLIKKNVGLFGIENIHLANNIRIDDFSLILASGEPCHIGSHVHIAARCTIFGKAGFAMEDFSGLSAGVQLITLSDDYSGEKLTNPTVPSQYTGGASGKVTLRRHVIIGANSIILPNLTIGEGSSVGALSLVTGDLEPWGIYAGVPAKRLKERSKNLLKLEKELLEESR